MSGPKVFPGLAVGAVLRQRASGGLIRVDGLKDGWAHVHRIRVDGRRFDPQRQLGWSGQLDPERWEILPRHPGTRSFPVLGDAEALRQTEALAIAAGRPKPGRVRLVSVSLPAPPHGHLDEPVGYHLGEPAEAFAVSALLSVAGLGVAPTCGLLLDRESSLPDAQAPGFLACVVVRGRTVWAASERMRGLLRFTAWRDNPAAERTP